MILSFVLLFFFKQKTAYEMRISDWSSDVCSSDLPNMLIAAPGDPMEVRACLRYLIANPQPSYLRLGKTGEPLFHKQVPSISPGKWLEVSVNGDKDTVDMLSTGATLALAMERSKATDGEIYNVYSMPLWGMSSKAIKAFNVADHKNK